MKADFWPKSKKMENLPYRTSFNYSPGEGREKYEKPSLTIPGESRTIQEILQMYQGGQLPEQRMSEYLDVEDIENINSYFAPGALDLTDLQALHDRSNVMKNTIDKAIEAKKLEEEEKAMQEKINQKAEEMTKSQDEKNEEES